MSQTPASVSKTQTPATTSSSDIEHIFDTALMSYKKKTKKDLKSHDLFKQLENCDSPDAILAKFQTDQFDTGNDDRLKTWLVPTLHVLCAFSDTLGEGVSLAFPPAKAIFAGVGVLLSTAKDVAESQDILIEIFGRIESFFLRLKIYTEISLTPAMTDKMVQITVEILDILATATKEMDQSRTKKFLKRLAGWTDLEDGLTKLDKLTQDEIVTGTVQIQNVAHNIDKKVTEVDEKVLVVQAGVQFVNDGVKAVDDKVRTMADVGKATAKVVNVVLERAIDGIEHVKVVNDNVVAVDDRVRGMADDIKATAEVTRQTANRVDNAERNYYREKLRMWQSPPDPSTNHNILGVRQHAGTAKWFVESNKCHKWKIAGSLLWIHGKAGSGKSVLCSAIINDVAELCKAGSASMAYFYFDFRDDDKQSRRKLLPSLLVQLSACSDAFFDILFRLYKAHGNGTSQLSDKVMTQCLEEMLTFPDHGPVYLILDALDECPDTSDLPSAREQVLEIVKDLVGLRLPSLHICVTSRPEVDISDALGSLASQTVSLQDELGQKQDISDYIRSVVHSGSGKFMKRWRPEDKEDIIEKLSQRADGMFRWVFCQLEMLRNCLPKNVRRILRELPASLDETYERMLREILEVNAEQVYRLLQCLAVSTRPLRVDELVEVLALDFDVAEEGVPTLSGWRSDDEEQDVLSACSSLIVVVDGFDHFGKTRVVQFAHFSVKEFLTSDRLANLKADISRFHIRLEPAHAVIAQACLAILLDKDRAKRFSPLSPLSKYAARHWVDHAHFGNVSSRIEDGMRRLFDPSKPDFTAWLNSYDLDHGWTSFLQPPYPSYIKPNTLWRGPKFSSSGEDDAPLCLYYAALCGFRDLTKQLITMYPQHVNARVGLNRSPLAVALHKRHFLIAELLHQHGAVPPTGYGVRTPLHAASADGFVDVAQWLLNIGADANAEEDDHRTPLHFAAANGRMEIVQILLDHGVGASLNARSAMHNNTPLHEASEGGHVDIMRLLIEHRVDVNARNQRQATPLHLVSNKGDAEAAQLLLKHGADVCARNQGQSTPLHLTWDGETAQILTMHGADVHARDQSQSTPLHIASSMWDAETVQLLIDHGADIHARDQSH
ncbi:hypothetical protein V8E53_005829 [Lactarius tabidus]